MVCIGLFCLKGNAQKVKYDSTMKIGKVGYKVVCNNKNIDKNQLTISLLGFEENRNDIELDVKGRVLAEEVDDVNNDGFPDLLLYIFTRILLSSNMFWIFLCNAALLYRAIVKFSSSEPFVITIFSNTSEMIFFGTLVNFSISLIVISSSPTGL